MEDIFFFNLGIYKLYIHDLVFCFLRECCDLQRVGVEIAIEDLFVALLTSFVNGKTCIL